MMRARRQHAVTNTFRLGRKDKVTRFLLLLGVLINPPFSVWAKDWPEQWRATSTTALAITGDVKLYQNKIVFEKAGAFSLEKAGQVEDFPALGEKVAASMFRITSPTVVIHSGGVPLCGSTSHPKPATFIAMWKSEPIGADIDPRSLAVFSGGDPPKSATGPTSCGIFDYEAGKSK